MADEPADTPERCGARIGQPLLRSLFIDGDADGVPPCEDQAGRCCGIHRATYGGGVLAWSYTVEGAVEWGNGEPDGVAETLRSTVEAARDFRALLRVDQRRLRNRS